MGLSFTTDGASSVIVLVDISRVQLTSPGRSAALRLVVDGSVVMLTSTGGASMMEYHQVAMLHGVASGVAAGDHTAEVQCRLHETGTLSFENDVNGDQLRRLSAVRAAPVDVSSQLWQPNTETLTFTSAAWMALPTPMTLSFSTSVVWNASVLLLADISRVQRRRSSGGVEFRIVVDDALVVLQTDTGGAAMMGYHAVSLHGVASSLPSGSHTAHVQCRLTSPGEVAFESDSDGEQHRRLSVLEAASSAVESKLWEPAAETLTLTSSSWAALPTPMTLDFSTSSPNVSVLVLADISRVQRAQSCRNVAFRVVVDGVAVVQTNTGSSEMMEYHQVALHGVAADLLPGPHTVEVQCKLPSAGEVTFGDSISGEEDRRLSVVAFGGDISAPPPPSPASVATQAWTPATEDFT
eukprot:2975775-Prymnesium_polylepis.1